MLSDNLMCTFPIGVHHNSCCLEVHYLVNFVVSTDTALYCLSSVHLSGVTQASRPLVARLTLPTWTHDMQLNRLTPHAFQEMS